MVSLFKPQILQCIQPLKVKQSISITITEEDLKRLQSPLQKFFWFFSWLDNQLMTKISSTTEEYHAGTCLINERWNESLVYSKASGELVGFCEIGDINDHFLQLEQKYQKDEDMHLKFAKTVLVIMICGHFTDITFSYATFAATNLTGEQLIPIFLEAIIRVETCGLRVTSITLDGSSVIRKYIKYLKEGTAIIF